jgi:hypothetical protein
MIWVSPDKHLDHKFDDGFGWRTTKRIGGQVAGRPVVVSSHVNRFDVFVKGPNNNLLQKFMDYSDWQPAGDDYEDMGGHLQSDPAAASWGAEPEVDTPGPVDVFAVGADQHLLHKAFDGAQWLPGLADWANMGGTMHGTPAALSRGRGLVDVIVAGPDDKLFYIGNNGFQWSPFRPLYVTATGAPVAVTAGRNRMDVFYIGSDNGVHHLPYDGSWLVWQNHGGAEL